MKTATFARTSAGLAASALLLAACGGGGGDSPAPAPAPAPAAASDIPISAAASSAGALAFVKTVAATSSDSADPLVAGEAVLATSETDEPDPGV